MEGIIVGIVQALIIVLIAPLVSGFARWLRSKMHSRKGPSILQDYYDIAKLFKRQDISPECSSPVHRLMPVIFLGVVLALAFGIPMITRVAPITELSDIILILYMLAIPRFFFALASLDTGDVYASTGGVRELIVGVLVEPSLMLALIVCAIVTQTTSLSVMGLSTATLAINSPFAFAVAGIAFACACYVELGKVPFDMAEAEQEIQEGPLQEYSGPSLAIIKMAMAMKQIIVVSWFIAIFVPWGSAIDMSIAGLAIGLVVWLVKLFICFFLAGIFENSVMRTRYFNLGKPTWAIFGVSLCAFVLCLVGV